MRMSLNLALGSCGLAALMTALTPAAAQSADQPTPNPRATAAAPSLEEVVVTARRRGEDSQKVPLSVAALSGDTLKAKGVTVSADLQYSVPGLTATGIAGSREDPPISLRGQGQTFGGALPSVQSYFGEVPIPGSLSTLYDLESVQVLKGPQGTLFGRNTTGGALLYTPVAPRQDFGGYVTVRGGNIGYKEAEGAINLPLGEKAALRVSGDILRRNGYTKDLTTGSMLDDQHRDDLRIQLIVRPTPDLTSQFLLTGSRVRQNGSSEILYSAPAAGLLSTPFFASIWGVPGYLAAQQANGDRTTYSVIGHPDYFKRDFWLASNITEFSFSGLKLKNIIGYQQTRSDSLENQGGVPTPVLYQGGANLLNPEPAKGGSSQFSDELQLSGLSLDSRLNWIVGASYIRQQPVGTNVQSVVLLNGPNPQALYNPQLTQIYAITTDYGVFAQGTYSLGDWVKGLSVTAGLRYSVDKQSTDTAAGQQGVTALGLPNGQFACNVTGLSPSTPLAQCHNRLSASFKAPSWTMSLDWQATPNTLVYLASRRGFKAGGFNALAVTPSLFQYGPEHLTDVELGLKGDWNIAPGVRLRTTTALYHSNVKGVQRFSFFTVPINGVLVPATATRNSGTADINGVEFEGVLLLGHYFQIDANYAHTDATIHAKSGFSPGSSFAGVPKDVFSVTGSVRLPTPPATGDMRLSATWYRQTKMPFVDNLDQEPEAFAPAYSLVNLRADWKAVLGSRVDLALFANNVANRRYLVDGIIALDAPLGFATHAFGAPHTYGLELKYHFD